MASRNSAFCSRIEASSRTLLMVCATMLAGSDIRNPYFDPRQVVAFNRSYLGWRGRVMLNRVMGKRYQENQPFQERGRAAPEMP